MDAEIDPDELADLLENERGNGNEDPVDGDLRIVDIRDERAFDRGHLPESESIPFPELTSRVPELEGADRIVTVCPHGIASQQAATLIGSYVGTTDARVESLRGGIEAWERDVGDLVTADATDGTTTSGGTTTDDGTATDATDDEGPDAPF